MTSKKNYSVPGNQPFNPINYPILFRMPKRLAEPSEWVGHIPFAFLLVDLLRPTTLVELGTQSGNSYCAFCQAVFELSLDTKCYGVETWQGDVHTNGLADLQKHHDTLYNGFSQLIQSTFDDAQPHFKDGSIDLLHMDGVNSYQSARHDFDYWTPKLSPRAVVLFHNIDKSADDFGISKLWDELKGSYPSFEFFHGHGLGVLAVGSEIPAGLDFVFNSTADPQVLREFFSQLGFGIENEFASASLELKLQDKNDTIQAYAAQAEKMLVQIQDLAVQVSNKDQTIQAYNTQATEMLGQIQDLAAQVSNKDQTLQAYATQANEMLGQIQALTTQMAERDQVIRSYVTQADKMQGQIQSLAAQGSNKDALILRESARAEELRQEKLSLVLQVEEQERSIQAISERIPDLLSQIESLDALSNRREQEVQSLSSSLGEKELSLLVAASRLDEVISSRSWKLANLFHNFRIWLVPDNSLRLKILKIIVKYFNPSFLQLRNNSGFNNDMSLVASSDLFNPDWYLATCSDVALSGVNPISHYLHYGWLEDRDPSPDFSNTWYLENYPAVKQAGMNPLVHYLRYGRYEGYLPHPSQATKNSSSVTPALDGTVLGLESADSGLEGSDSDLEVSTPTLELSVPGTESFDPVWYLQANPDVASTGLNPYLHYRDFGKAEGRSGVPPVLIMQAGGVQFDPAKETVLVVSHEASLTGAPVLSYNIIKTLHFKYNVIALYFVDGIIANNMREESALALGPLPGWTNPLFIDYATSLLARQFKIKFAIVNSVVTRSILAALAKHYIPTVSLIHEFASYTKPSNAMVEAILWASETVYSTTITLENTLAENAGLQNQPLHIIPQGQCEIPSTGSANPEEQKHESTRLLSHLLPPGSPEDTFLVIGVGFVQMRKGVDLFLECATQLVKNNAGIHFRFVWIGSGYEPERDLAYSVYLKDQVQRSNLLDHFEFLPETTSIETAYQAADLMLLSSRLDPLPNVAIDAMSRGLPLVCFKRTTGIADILIEAGLEDACVAPYIDPSAMAEKVMTFAQSKSYRSRIGEELKSVAKKVFDMAVYGSKIESLALGAIARANQEQQDDGVIRKTELAQLDYFTNNTPPIATEDPIRRYVRNWASGINRRKLFPGFHPGIFQEQYPQYSSDQDPLACYLRAGQPSGPWKFEVISPIENNRFSSPSGRVALHIHAYYADLLPEIMAQLSLNRTLPDLFISVPNEDVHKQVFKITSTYNGVIRAIRQVPNRGRDIGPFLSEFQKEILQGYEYVGHMHTKKTALMNLEAMGKVWFSFLLANLLGGKNRMIDTILAKMDSDKSIGLVFPDDPWIVDWGENLPFAKLLAERLAIGPLPANINFPVGTMFWARVDAIQPLFNLNLGWEEYPNEPLPYDGSMLHAIERLLPIIVTENGFKLAVTNVPGVSR
jgi:glycosyltransferase involved in cell wall biosynthesis